MLVRSQQPKTAISQQTPRHTFFMRINRREHLVGYTTGGPAKSRSGELTQLADDLIHYVLSYPTSAEDNLEKIEQQVTALLGKLQHVQQQEQSQENLVKAGLRWRNNFLLITSVNIFLTFTLVYYHWRRRRRKSLETELVIERVTD